jgi:hypothetical protein
VTGRRPGDYVLLPCLASHDCLCLSSVLLSLSSQYLSLLLQPAAVRVVVNVFISIFYIALPALLLSAVGWRTVLKLLSF